MKSEYEFIKEWREKQDIIDRNRPLIEKWVSWLSADIEHTSPSEYERKTKGELLFILKTLL